jgi:hypothetical protein
MRSSTFSIARIRRALVRKGRNRIRISGQDKHSVLLAMRSAFPARQYVGSVLDLEGRS